jgi:hypothetical protein
LILSVTARSRETAQVRAVTMVKFVIDEMRGGGVKTWVVEAVPEHRVSIGRSVLFQREARVGQLGYARTYDTCNVCVDVIEQGTAVEFTRRRNATHNEGYAFLWVRRGTKIVGRTKHAVFEPMYPGGCESRRECPARGGGSGQRGKRLD